MEARKLFVSDLTVSKAYATLVPVKGKWCNRIRRDVVFGSGVNESRIIVNYDCGISEANAESDYDVICCAKIVAEETSVPFTFEGNPIEIVL